MTLAPYPAYKGSGTPGLGAIPEHWRTERQRRVVNMLVSNIDKHTLDGETLVRLCNYVDVYKHDRITGRLPFMRASASPEDAGRFRLAAGDVLVTKDSEAWNDIGVPALVEYTAPDLVSGYHLAILRPRASVIRGAYLFRATQCYGVAAQYHVCANGVTRYGLPQNGIKSIVLPVPPIDEQDAIARYLDHADRRINRLIRAKRRLIELLEEQKQAIINHAVTRGLDPNVRLKPSGIDWLGNIPEGWEVRRLRALADFVTSGSRGWATYYSDDGPIFLRIGNISTRSIELKLNRTQRVAPPRGGEGERTRVAPNDLLISITAQMGAVGLVPADLGEAYVNQHIALVRLSEARCNPRFVAFYLLSPSGKRQSDLMTNGGTKQGLGLDDVRNLLVLLPGCQEQADIAGAIESDIAGLQSAVDKAQRQIDLLHEYRTRLIADVVTGKLDVRGVELPPLDEGEPLDTEYDGIDPGGDEAEDSPGEDDGDGAEDVE